MTAQLPRLPSTDTPLDVGMVGTYPPTRCGIATFTASIASSMCPPSSPHRAFVVASVERAGQQAFPPEVIGELERGSPTSQANAATLLNGCDVIVLQHEFGIYGGPDGSEVVDLLEQVSQPVIAVLHTVTVSPTPGQRAVIEALAERASALVVQSSAARARLVETFDVDLERVQTIPHGARPNLSSSPGLTLPDPTPTVISWGLLGPGKGVEFGIEAMALLADLERPPRYLVLGQTHPKVVEAEGERYRESLVALAHTLGVADRVVFDGTYHPTDRVMAEVARADIALLPYETQQQVVSGVLVEAVASSTPVVATSFPHACELLGSGAGFVVPPRDPAAIAAAIRSLCTDRQLAARAIATAAAIAPSLFWDNVGRAYLGLASRIASRREVAA